MIAMSLLAVGCGSDGEIGLAEAADPLQRRFDPAVLDLDDLPGHDTLIGTQVAGSSVVPLGCIPSREDPVGTWVRIDVVDIRSDAGTIDVDLSPVDARFGSHPSGCSEPEIVGEESALVLTPDGAEPPSSASTSADGVASMRFDLGDWPESEVAIVILPRLTYLDGSGGERVTSYGVLEAFTINR